MFISNIPEAFSASAGMRRDDRPVRVIMTMWCSIALLSAAAAAIGYGALGQGSPEVVAATSAFAAGAIITMLVGTMVPEAVEHAGRWVGLLTMVGFGTAFLLRAAT